MKIIKISREGLGSYYEMDLENAIEELRSSFENENIEKLTFEIVEMSKDEYYALPEFMGW